LLLCGENYCIRISSQIAGCAVSLTGNRHRAERQPEIAIVAVPRVPDACAHGSGGVNSRPPSFLAVRARPSGRRFMHSSCSIWRNWECYFCQSRVVLARICHAASRLADGAGIETNARGGDAVGFSALAASQPTLAPECSVTRFRLLSVTADRRRMPLKPGDRAARTDCSVFVAQ
jgi:hypothetical protein